MSPIKQRLKSCGIKSLAVLERRHNTAAILIIVLVALVVVSITPQNAIGKEGGTNEYDQCVCHGSNPSSDVKVILDLPVGGYNTSETYLIGISFTGGPEENQDPDTAQGGFYLDVDSGTLAATGSDVTVTADGKEANHTAAGNGKRSWNLQWTAGSADSTVFTLRVNSVNGDGQPNLGDEDRWNKITVTYNSDGTTGVKLAEKGWEAPEFMLEGELAVVLLCLAGITGYTMRKVTRGRRRE